MQNYRENLSLEKKIKIKNANTLAKAKNRSIFINKSNEKDKDTTKSTIEKQKFVKIGKIILSCEATSQICHKIVL